VASPSAIKYQSAVVKARILRDTATDPRLGSMTVDKTQVYYHASLAVFVAAWEAYIENLVRDFFQITADPTNIKFHVIHTIANDTAERELKKFNTPNADNSRNLLIQASGYDAISDWVWSARGMGAVATRQRLDEILKVRHSFAHGFSIPAFSWNQASTGRVRLTAKSIDDVQSFFKFLVSTTDDGMKKHIKINYNINLVW
jgi:RiboL-PSP-HEPN